MGSTTEPVFSIRNLVVEFVTDSGIVRAVDDVSYDLYQGETLGVVGESGSGKTVTVLAALGLLPSRRLHHVDGSVLLNGTDLLQLAEKDRRALLGREIGMVFQDPKAALNPVQRIGDQIAESLLLHDSRLSDRAAHLRSVELLELVGVPQPSLRARQFPHQFSGGMCQRAVIAMAIANRPGVLIADEPTTAVDVSVQAQLLEVLRVAQEETGAATVLITHDMGVIAEAADRLCVMYGGRVVESGQVLELFESPRHPYTAGLLGCIPRLGDTLERLTPIPGQPPEPSNSIEGCAFAARCSVRKERETCVDLRPLLDTWRANDHMSACHFANETSSSDRDHRDQLKNSMASNRQPSSADVVGKEAPRAVSDMPVLEVVDLVKRFPVKGGVLSRVRQHVHAVDGVTFEVAPGETLGLVGESGCGKSTTARMILRLEEASSGSIIFDGVDVTTAGRSALRRVRQQVQMVFQDPNSSLNPRLSVGDNVAEPLRLAGGIGRSQRQARVRELFEQVGLRPGSVDRLPSEFSGGQRQRVAIARALALQPKLLLLDEPVSALDVSVQAQVLNLLDDLQRELGLAYVFVSHDLSVVRHVSDRVAVMYLGKIVEVGSRDEIFSNARHPYTQALLASVPIPTPSTSARKRRPPLAGDLPSPADPPSGCRFRTRCPLAAAVCADEEPILIPHGKSADARVACHFAEAPNPFLLETPELRSESR